MKGKLCDSSGFGEGQQFLGSTSVVTDSAGNAAFDVALQVTVAADWVVTSTAIREPSGASSELSQCLPIQSGGSVCSSDGRLIEGFGQIGDFRATCGSDGGRWSAHGSSLFYQIADPVVQFELAAIAAGSRGGTIAVDIEASKENANANLNLRALLFNFATGNYVSLPGIMPLNSTDQHQSFELPSGSDPNDFIKPGSHEVRLLLQTIQSSGLSNVRTRLGEVLYNFD